MKYNTFGNNNVFDIDAALLVKRHKKLDKTLAKGSGKSFLLSGLYDVSIINGIPEITGFTRLKNEHGDLFPYFYVVDDPALKRKLLDENEKKLLEEIGADYPAVRKKLLDEYGGPFLTIKSGRLRSAWREPQSSRAFLAFCS